MPDKADVITINFQKIIQFLFGNRVSLHIENLLFCESINDIWKSIQKKIPEICYCQDLLADKARIEFIIDEAINHVAIVSEITGKSEQEITDELNNLLFSNNTKLVDFTASWLKEMQHSQLDEEELIVYLADIGMSEEEFFIYSEDSNYDISFFLKFLSIVLL